MTDNGVRRSRFRFLWNQTLPVAETSAFHEDEGRTDQVEVRRAGWRCRRHHCLLLPQHSVRFVFCASVCLYAFHDLILFLRDFPFVHIDNARCPTQLLLELSLYLHSIPHWTVIVINVMIRRGAMGGNEKKTWARLPHVSATSLLWLAITTMSL